MPSAKARVQKSNGTSPANTGLKTITHRPQSWFNVQRGYRQELRLRSNTTAADGSPAVSLRPFGWITHIHKAKSGYLERTAMFRQLVWPLTCLKTTARRPGRISGNLRHSGA